MSDFGWDTFDTYRAQWRAEEIASRLRGPVDPLAVAFEDTAAYEAAVRLLVHAADKLDRAIEHADNAQHHVQRCLEQVRDTGLALTDEARAEVERRVEQDLLGPEKDHF